MNIINKTFTLFTVILFSVNMNVHAQEPNFSMYQYAPIFTNPGEIGAVEDVQVMLNYRSQSVDVGENFSSSALSVFYPFALGNHRLVVAGNFLNDKASNFLSTNSGILGVAYSVSLTEKSSLSLGIQAGLFQRKIDGDFTTDDQFVSGVFDPSTISGDAVINQYTSYPSLSTGIHYTMLDDNGDQLGFVGFSLFNAIEPDVSFVESAEDKLPSSFKATAGYKAYQGLKFSAMPTMRWVNQAGNNFFNLGSIFGYELASAEEGAKKINLGLWYNTNELGVFSIAYEQPNITVGISYDTPFGADLNTGQNGIFELAVAYKLKGMPFSRASETTGSK